MGTILTANRRTDTFYNHLRVYANSEDPGFYGWGIRRRATSDENLSVICGSYPIVSGGRLGSISFFVDTVDGGVPTPSLYFGVWSLVAGGATFNRVASSLMQITAADVGGTWTDDTIYTVTFDPISFPVIAGEYYISFYSDGLYLYETTGTVADGAYEWNGMVPTYNINDPASPTSQAVIKFNQENNAYSVEAWGSVIDWELFEVGGCVMERAEDWQDPAFCTTDGWTNPTNIYEDDSSVAVSTGAGNSIWLDLGAGVNGNWNHLITSFPDYTTQGVRAMVYVRIKGKLEAAGGGSITVEWSEDNHVAPPALGWQNLIQVDFDNHFPGVDQPYDTTAELPEIAKWLKITEAGTNVNDEVEMLECFDISTGVADGIFYVNHSQAIHHMWIDNYATTERVLRITANNIAGAESEASYEFTNRINKD
jgi:hypothetical protein